MQNNSEPTKSEKKTQIEQHLWLKKERDWKSGRLERTYHWDEDVEDVVTLKLVNLWEKSWRRLLH